MVFIENTYFFIPVYFSSQREDRDIEHYTDIHMRMCVRITQAQMTWCRNKEKAVAIMACVFIVAVTSWD